MAALSNPSLPGDATSASPAAIGARLDRLPATRSIWTLVTVLAIGGWFEFYDLFFTAYVGPALVKNGIYATTTASFFGFAGLGAFVAASFAGLFVGTLVFSSLADRLGRKSVFTFSLLWYSIATLVMAAQSSAADINVWRFIAGIGIGVELVTIDAYASELVPSICAAAHSRYCTRSSSPPCRPGAFFAWWLVPLKPFGFDGWRWVVWIGALGAVIVWALRRGLPESPRWLAQQGRDDEAERVMARLERQVAAEYGRALPPPLAATPEPVRVKAAFSEIWVPPYRRRTLMLMVFNTFQSIGLLRLCRVGADPADRAGRDDHAQPALFLRDRDLEPDRPDRRPAGRRPDRAQDDDHAVRARHRVFGTLFAFQTSPALLMLLGVLITISSALLSVGYHAYQSELFPTRVRARAVGVVYSTSRISAMFSGFMIAFALRHFACSGIRTDRRGDGDCHGVDRVFRAEDQWARVGCDLSVGRCDTF